MKQLRLLLFLLVACVAQVSHGEDLTKKWAEAAELEKNVTTALLYAQDDNDAASRINSIIQARYMTYDESISHVRSYINKIKGKLPKWDEKISKGKKIDYDDALKAAVCYSSSYAKLQDYSKAAKYFEVAADGSEDNTLKAILRLSAVGCRYQADKDKTTAAAAINFNIPAGSESAMICIARKYGMQDIASEKLQQVFNVNKRQITRAIRSNNIEELKKYEIYDIPEVDSVLALETRSKDLYWKCIMKHKMYWPLIILNYKDVMSRTDLPANVFKYAFFLPQSSKEENEWKCKMLDYIQEELPQYDPDGNKAHEIFEYLNNLRRRSDVAALTMAVIVNAFVQSPTHNNYRDFIFDLNEYTSQLLGYNESAKAKSVENINKVYGDYFTINTNGVVKLKYPMPNRGYRDDDFRKAAAKLVELYDKLANWIFSSDIMDYKPAEMPSNMDEIKNILAQNIDEAVIENGEPFSAFLTVDVDGSIVSIDAKVSKQISGKSAWKKGVSHNVKMQTKCKPAMRGGQPFKDVLEIK